MAPVMLPPKPAKESDLGQFEQCLATINGTDPQASFCAMDLLCELAPRLDPSRAHLVAKILKLDWLSRDVGFGEKYCDLLVYLVINHLYHLEATIQALLMQFRRKDIGEEERDISVEPVHHVLKTILDRVPVASACLLEKISEVFPNVEYCSSDIGSSYIHHILQITLYCPQEAQAILRTVFEEILKLDIRVSEMEQQKRLLESETSIMNLDSAAPTTSKAPDFGPVDVDLKSALDSYLMVILVYVKRCCFGDGSKLNVESSRILYAHLVRIFRDVILPCPGCRSLQYVIFYMCACSKNFCIHYLELLWAEFLKPDVPVKVKLSCMSYLASFITRHQLVTLELVEQCLSCWRGYILRYLEDQETLGQDASPLVHAAFYAVCQAIFYLVAFRIQEFLADSKGFAFLKSLNLQHIVQCRLNPLRYTDPAVLKNFTSVTRIYQLAYCDTITERNKRLALYDAFLRGQDMGEIVPTFYPFDPCILERISAAFVKRFYRNYRGLSQDDSPTEENCNRMDSTDQKQSCSELKDFMMYNVTPGFRHSFGNGS